MKIDFSKYPKVELHLHLDCSLSFAVVQQINPSIDLETYQHSFVGPVKCTDLNDFLARTVHAIQLLQTKEALRLATIDLLRQLKTDNVIYAEIRFAPLLHLKEGLTPTDVVETVTEAANEGMKATGVEAGIILCTLRHFDETQSMETVRLVEQFRDRNVVGFDIASDEAGYPIDKHVSAFAYAKANGLNITCHAGEAKGPESVWETLKHFHPARIGHGVRSVEDPNLMEYLKKANIHLEICPTSNVQTNVVDRLEHHPADFIYRSGISMSVNTDGRTIANTSLAKEYHILRDIFDWELAHFLRCNLEAIEHAFISEEKKAELKQKIIAAYK